MKNEFQLTFIVPVYGKDPKITKDYFASLLNKNPNANFIFSYKNSADNSLNYDSLNELSDSFENVKVIKNDSSKLRTAKVLKAINEVETKYFQIIDAHHSINLKPLKKLNRKLSKIDKEYIMLPYIWRNVDDHTIKIRLPKNYRLGAGTAAHSTKSILEIIENIKLDIVFFDDSVIPLFYFLEKELKGEKISKKRIFTFHYNRNYGTKISATTFTSDEMKKNIKLITDQSNHMYQIIEALFTRIASSNGDYNKFSKGYKELISRYIEYINWREKNVGNDPRPKINKLWSILD